MTSRTTVGVIECVPFGADMITCRFEKPHGFVFTPGQYFLLTLQTADGDQTKPFSLAAAPDDPYLEMTTRDSGSAFKSALRMLSPGDPVRVAGPAGTLVLPRPSGTVVFLIGGVGITPVRSMIRDAVHQGEELTGALIYGNRDESCIAYRRELDAVATDRFAVVHVLEHPSSGWTGETGFIDADLVRRHADARRVDHFVVTGPPPMVTAMERVLDGLDVEEGRRLIERFGAVD